MRKIQMLDAYKTDKNLDALEARLPEEADEVKHLLEDVYKTQASNPRAAFLLARCQLLCNDMGQAKHTLEDLITQHPDHVGAKVELARCFFNEGDAGAAIKLLSEATGAAPEIAENWKLLSEYLQHDEQTEASQDALNQHAMIKAFNDDLLSAEMAFSKADFRKSDQMCRKLLQQVPGEIRTLRVLARIAKQYRYYETSTSMLADCIETRPNDTALGLEYAYALLANQKHRESLEQCQRLIGLAPEVIDVYELKAEVLYFLGQYEEAIAIYGELSGLDEKRTSCLLRLGRVFNTVGKTTEAINCFQNAMEHESIPAQAWWELSNLKTYRFSTDEIESMQRLLKVDGISEIHKVLINFALGKALEDEQQFSESFQHYHAANSAYAKIRPSRYASSNSKLKSFFTPEFFAGKKGCGDATDAPIFVVGLPRSGSTLVEQILSSHSMVDATMELTEVVSIVRELNSPDPKGQGQYPQSMAGLTAKQIQALAQRYLEYTQRLRQQAPHFVDKLPGNFQHIGLIKTLFPNAKIIDIRRNPMASGWSVYKQFFDDSFLFSYDLETIGKYYNNYIDLMDHWHRVLPGQILTISYEELVDDLAKTVNNILQYCGLAFEDACLDFHLNKRAVATPSSAQVRQPLYDNAVEHWKNYDEFLTPLKQAIGNG